MLIYIYTYNINKFKLVEINLRKLEKVNTNMIDEIKLRDLKSVLFFCQIEFFIRFLSIYQICI